LGLLDRHKIKSSQSSLTLFYTNSSHLCYVCVIDFECPISKAYTVTGVQMKHTKRHWIRDDTFLSTLVLLRR
jgi:hypothetical protein